MASFHIFHAGIFRRRAPGHYVFNIRSRRINCHTAIVLFKAKLQQQSFPGQMTPQNHAENHIESEKRVRLSFAQTGKSAAETVLVKDWPRRRQTPD